MGRWGDERREEVVEERWRNLMMENRIGEFN